MADLGNKTSLGFLWNVLYYGALAAAVVPAGIEAVVFAHDRWVVHQDFACLERHSIQDGKKLDTWDAFPICNIDSRKPFGQRSIRAWQNGLPLLWFSMNTDWIRCQLLMGLPFLLAVAAINIKRRASVNFTQWAILVAAWFLLLGCLAVAQWPPDVERLRAEAPGKLASTVNVWWWTLRATSIIWLIAVVALAGLRLRHRQTAGTRR